MFRRTTLDVSFQGVSRLFAAAYGTADVERNANTEESRRRYYLPLIRRSQEEDIIYLEQKLKIIIS